MKTYSIVDYGAIEADLLQTSAIQAAIDACYRDGGGEVLVPAGIYRTGGLRLRSRVTLHLLSGASLEGSGNPADYQGWRHDPLEPIEVPPAEPTQYRSALRTSRWNNALIRAIDAHDIAILGEPGSLLCGMNCYDPTGEENYRGPHGINLWDCENVTLDGYTLRSAGNWAHAIFRTKNVTIRNVTVQGGHDGVDLFLCENALIEDCIFRTGDDSLAGFGNRKVVMRRCVLNSSCSAIRFGGTDVLIEACEDGGAPRFAFRGSLTPEEKARSASTTASNRRRTLNVFLYYCDARFGALPDAPGNITVRDCRFDGAYDLFKMAYGKHIWCCNEPLRSITFENCRLTGLRLPIGILGDPEKPIEFRLRNVELSSGDEAESPVFLDAENFSLLELTNVHLKGYDAPRLVVRSEGQIIVAHCDDFETVREAPGQSGIQGN